MTYIHLLNCLILTFAPPFILYSSSSLGEQRCWSMVVTAGIACVVSQFIKMFLVALFVEVETSESFDLTHDLMRSSIGFVDMAGMAGALAYDFFARHRLSQDDRIFGAALGWVTGESLLGRLVPLWASARKAEFLWSNVFLACQANVNLVYYLAYIGFVWLFRRRDLGKQRTVVIILGLVCMFYPTLINYLSSTLPEAEVLGAELCISVVLFVVSRMLRKSYQESRLTAPKYKTK